MANHVERIKDELNTIAAASYAGASKIRYLYDLSKNDSRTPAKGYGVKVLSGVPTDTLTKSFTIDQDFELILADTIARTHDDEQREEVIDRLFDRADDIAVTATNTKVNLSSIVIDVSAPSYGEPEFFDENKIVALRTQFTVKYRRNL